MKHELVLVGQQTGMKARTQEELLTGFYRNFVFLVKRDVKERRFVIRTWAATPDESNAQALGRWLEEYPQAHPLFQRGVYDGKSVTVLIELLPKERQRSVDAILAFLNDLTGYLGMYGFACACEDCGNPNDGALYRIGNGFSFKCQNCYGALSQSALSQRDSVPGNLPAGIVGAFLFSLAGAALWVLLSQLGYVASITGLVTIVCAFKGYETFGKKIDLPAVIACCVISLLMGVIATYCSIGLDIYNAFKDDYHITLMDAFQSIPFFWEDPEISSGYIGDLLLGYLFMALGAFSSVRNAIKASRHGFVSQKLAEKPRMGAGV